jgi:hypothetical protein
VASGTILGGRDEDVEKCLGDLHDFQDFELFVGSRLGDGIDRRPFEQLHDEEHRAVFARVVVEHGHGARVIDRVGDVPFAQEPGFGIPSPRQVRVQKLDRTALAVAIGGGVDGRHPTYTQQAVELPLSMEHLADPSFGALHSQVTVAHPRS